MNSIHDFLSSLYGYFNDGSVLYLWTLPDKQTHPFVADTLAEMATAAGRLSAGHDVYFGVGSLSQPLGPYERANNDNVTAIPGLWIDIDIKHPVHKVKELPPDLAAAMSLLPDISPSLVVWSGYGIHVYWLFREPWELESPEERTMATELLRAIQGYVKYAASQRGWKIDPTADLARVLRLPGTLNHKIPDDPVQAMVIEKSDARYNPSDIADILPPVPVTTGQIRTEKFERRPTDGPAELMLRNCRFLQHCQLNASEINYAEWLAALTNIVRANDGIDAAHKVSAMDAKRYNQKDTDHKITEALNMMNPQNCNYIRSVIGFPGCPQGGCGVQAPCGWSLARVAQARAVVRAIPAPSPEVVLTPEVLGALATLKKDDQLEYARFKATCKGRINLNDLEKQVKQYSRHVKQDNHLHIVQPGDKPGTRMLKDTVSELPIDLALPPNFRFEQSGILFAKENAAGDLQVYKAAGAPVVISERVFNIDSQTEKIEICFRYLNRWRKVLFPRSTVFNAKSIIRLADFGVPVSSETSKFLVKWFDALADVNQDRIPITQAVSKLGWRGDREFVLPNFNSKYRIDVDDEGTQKATTGFTTTGDIGEWVSRMVYLRQSPVARFTLSCGFAGPLLKILGQRNFIVHNWGGSRGGKSAVLWAAMSIWGNPDKLLVTFNGTESGIERTAALHSDLPLGLNEREVLTDRKKQDINSLLYVLGEGRGRRRANRTGLQEIATWRTIVLSTGEGQLSSSGSLDGVMTRVLEINEGPLAHDIDFAKSLYYFLPQCHGLAGPAFLGSLLSADYATIYSNYQEFQAIFRANYPDRIDSHIDAVACVATADYLSSGWIFNEPWEQAKVGATAMGMHVLSKLITVSEASESERAWAMFMDWIVENFDRFKERSNGPRFGYVAEVKNPFEDGDVGVFVIRSIVNQFLSDRFSGHRKILQEWALSGKIESYNHGGKIRYDIPGKALGGGVRPRVIKIKHIEDVPLSGTKID